MHTTVDTSVYKKKIISCKLRMLYYTLAVSYCTEVIHGGLQISPMEEFLTKFSLSLDSMKVHCIQSRHWGTVSYPQLSAWPVRRMSS